MCVNLGLIDFVWNLKGEGWRWGIQNGDSRKLDSDSRWSVARLRYPRLDVVHVFRCYIRAVCAIEKYLIRMVMGAKKWQLIAREVRPIIHQTPVLSICVHTTNIILFFTHCK